MRHPHYSNRLDWSAPANPIAEAVRELRRSGADLIDLTESNPTRCGFVYPEAVAESLAGPASFLYEPDPRGLLRARESVARYAGVEAERILLTASTSEAYSHLFKLLCDPGDEVLVPVPSYPLFEYLARLDGVNLVQYPLFYDDGWHLDFSEVQKRTTGRTRAVIIVNPNNPTGSYLKRRELEELESLGLPLISDEVFSDFEITPGTADRVRTIAMESNATLSVSLSGLSKLCGLPQMKLGWMILGGAGWPAAMDRLELIADTYLSVNTPVQQALPNLLEARITDQILERIRANRAMLSGALLSEGGWSAVVRIPEIHTEEEWVLRYLQEQSVLVQPGYFYDFQGGAFVVLSLLPEPGRFREAILRLRELDRDFAAS